MINVYLKKHVFYLLAIVLFAFVINLGTAFDNVMMRMKQPLFQQVLVATVAMLYLYLYIVQKIYHYFFFRMAWFIGLKPLLKAGIFVIAAAGLISLIHVHILNLLLAQRNHGTVFTFDYFTTDFWFFFLPLLSYVIILYLKPNRLLFRLPARKTEEMSNGHAPQAQELLQQIVEPIEMDQEDELLKIWRISRVKSFVFDYFRKFSKEERWHLEQDIPLWKVVILEKSELIMFGYFINGEKWALHHVDDKILSNPWLVKVSQNCYINMLYVVDGLCRRSMLKMDLKMGNRVSKEVNMELVILHEEIRAILLSTTNSDKLDQLLIVTRRMKVNYKNFWESTFLEQLDENRLMDPVGSINRKNN